MNDNEQLGLLDIITIIGFMLNLQNYGKNVDQSKMQNAISLAVSDIHDHLQEQDRKIDSIYEMLKGEKDGSKRDD